LILDAFPDGRVSAAPALRDSFLYKLYRSMAVFCPQETYDGPMVRLLDSHVYVLWP